jgi:hypothetical protein
MGMGVGWEGEVSVQNFDDGFCMKYYLSQSNFSYNKHF